jgi:hypothetical protein
MSTKPGMGPAVALTVLGLVIGLFAIAVLIGVGEGANNAMAAFAAVSIPLALLAGLFSWIAPRARWYLAAALAGPVTLLSLAGSWSGSVMMLGAIWTAGITCAGAYVGSRLKRPHPPTAPPTG